MENPKITIDVASVKVMRSFDYCHFEVCLTSTFHGLEDQIATTDELRKSAARLADKAVEQYKVMKASYERSLNDKSTYDFYKHCADAIREKPEGDRTINEQAQMKAFDDKQWRERRAYDYQDDYNWDNE